MRLEISFSDNLQDKMRSAGYHYDGQDSKFGELKFYRSLTANLFPRFHIYGKRTKNLELLTLNLHIDQKAPVYQGSTAHGGDYEGPVIEKEIARLRGLLIPKGSLPELPPLD